MTSVSDIPETSGPADVTIRLKVNGQERSAQAEPRTLLIQFLRNQLGLLGAHVGCQTGQCGACTVLLDGEAIKSCMVLAVQAEGREVTTIEGVANGNELHPIQQAFWDEGGLQCGYCTPGMVLSTMSLLNDNPRPTPEQIRHELEGNICRCTGYHNIVKSVEEAARRLQNGQEGAK